MHKAYHVLLDVKGLMCPMPILKAKKVLKGLTTGEILKVQATDPASEADFKAFTQQTKDQLLEVEIIDGVFNFLIQKG
ncbi:sulfurtransferase TusA family protein [Thiotrichales bacterium 19X7-9]|nr:sulfurtransferase TusA family protein [Thiotrichales bacterium 19X7-9]